MNNNRTCSSLNNLARGVRSSAFPTLRLQPRLSRLRRFQNARVQNAQLKIKDPVSKYQRERQREKETSYLQSVTLLQAEAVPVSPTHTVPGPRPPVAPLHPPPPPPRPVSPSPRPRGRVAPRRRSDSLPNSWFKCRENERLPRGEHNPHPHTYPHPRAEPRGAAGRVPRGPGRDTAALTRGAAGGAGREEEEEEEVTGGSGDTEGSPQAARRGGDPGRCAPRSWAGWGGAPHGRRG